MFTQFFRMMFVAIIVCLSSVTHAKTVKLANGEWAPYCSDKLKHGGFITHIVREAFEAEGYTVEFDYLPWKRGFEQAKAGNYDASLVWSKNDERQQFFLYSDPVITLSTALFQQKAKPISWSSKSDLANYKIGGVTGYAYGIEDLEKTGKVKVQRIASPENNYKKLSAGRLDIVLEDTDVGLETVTKLGLRDKIEPNAKPLTERDYFVIVSKKSPQKQEILDAFNRGLAKLKAQGKLEAYREASVRGEYKM
ncbi:transporter substrate-binding domain-containing protein [Vibrio caribbeanicus]|uniref:ABC-type amino acid transport/signal transduction system, periplasmic component n=2 Tax=Vibrio caribbeanicus TaxID=701175 RepID=E3BJX8_9VIBR|nr:transporter substrate-binding domain-containing protein [Vibrio caribbeanicus]EFP96606.1 ABC-type amino acid transport/signal transduction system, periplasmic component [Vibrio caribbeanicus ATCC BAA-2122]MCY9844533.1 transporter substrate-binding domain-containing protein [Vibrio caribbeanicus]